MTFEESFYLVESPAMNQQTTQIIMARVFVQTYPALSGSQIA